MIVERDWHGTWGSCIMCGYLVEVPTKPPKDIIEKEDRPEPGLSRTFSPRRQIMDSEYLDVEDHIAKLIQTESEEFDNISQLLENTQDSHTILGKHMEGDHITLHHLNSLVAIRSYILEMKKKLIRFHFLSIQSSRLEHYLQINRIYKLGVETDELLQKEVERREEEAKYPISELRLPKKTWRALAWANIKYVEDLLPKTLDEILGLRNFGEVYLKELAESMTKIGYEAQMEAGNKPAFRKVSTQTNES
jgi:hypothetical protein